MTRHKRTNHGDEPVIPCYVVLVPADVDFVDAIDVKRVEIDIPRSIRFEQPEQDNYIRNEIIRQRLIDRYILYKYWEIDRVWRKDAPVPQGYDERFTDEQG